MCAGGAAADTDWQTVSLDGNPDFTMDLPAFATDYQPKAEDAAKGTLMHFTSETGDEGALSCILSRFPNEKGLSAKKQRAMLKTSDRDVLCSDDEAANLTIGGSESTTVDGLPAGDCVASYTNNNSEFHGWVMNPTMIIARKSHFLLTCYYVTDSQDEATAKWVLTWSKVAAHMQQSLHIPKNER